MLKKVLVGVIAAGALSVPLAGAAWADPAPDNPGLPGNINGDRPSAITHLEQDFANYFGVPPGKVMREFPPGSLIKNFTP
jgi:hypothetical protein